VGKITGKVLVRAPPKLCQFFYSPRGLITKTKRSWYALPCTFDVIHDSPQAWDASFRKILEGVVIHFFFRAEAGTILTKR
jgi:hypothetical protein